MTPQQIEQIREALRVIAKRICGSDCKARYMDVRKEDPSTHWNPRPGARCATCIAKDALALLDPLTSEPMAGGADLIAAERQRQISVEGWTPEHDAQHWHGEIAEAAACYIQASRSEHQHMSRAWPWQREWWKPSPEPVRNLVKAGALIAAEIDRLQARNKVKNDAGFKVESAPDTAVQPTTHLSASRFPMCECGGVAVANASGEITRTCIRCGGIVLLKPEPTTPAPFDPREPRAPKSTKDRP